MLFARDFRAIARDRLRENYWLVFLVTAVALLLGGAISGFSTGIRFETNIGTEALSDPSLSGLIDTVTSPRMLMVWQLASFYSLALLLVGGAVAIGLCRYNLALIDRKERSFSTLWSGFQSFGKALGLRLLTALFTFLWTMLLVIPGIIATYRYSMAFFVLAEDPQIGVLEAIRVSKRMMHGNKWRLFCLQFSFIGWMLLSAIPAGVLANTLSSAILYGSSYSNVAGLTLLTGVVSFICASFLSPYINAATTAFYLDVSGQAYRLGDGQDNAGAEPTN